MALSLNGHLRKCAVYLDLPRSDIQKCKCKYKPASLSDRTSHRSICSTYQASLIIPDDDGLPIICTKCGVSKPKSDFSVNKIKKNGRDSSCKVCRSNSLTKYDNAALNAVARSKYEPEKKKEYYKSHQSRILRTKKEYRQKNLDVVKARISAWVENNKDHLRQARREKKKEILDRLFEMLGYVCAACGESDRTVLTVDHINNDGHLDRHRGSMGWKREIVKGLRPIKDYRILCHSCNVSTYLKNPVHHLKVKIPTGIMKKCWCCQMERDTSELQPDVCSACARMNRFKMKVECFKLFGSSCQGCGETDVVKLCLDHLASNGNRMRKVHGAGTEIYRKILDGRLDKNEFACLCFNCNHQRTRNAGTDFITPAVYDVKSINVMPIPSDYAVSFLNSHHYAGFGRGAKVVHGAYVDGKLIGVAKYSSLIRQEVATSDNFEPSESLELDRFCLDPYYHKKNTASFVLSKSVSLLKRQSQAKALYSFADPSRGHSGGIYRASNWAYLGETVSSYFYVDEFGAEINKKTVFDKAKRLGMKENEYAAANDLRKEKTPAKHKFAYYLD